MPKYRDSLPQLQGGQFLTDGGIETTMIFHEGFDLPHFAAFELLNNEPGRSSLQNYFDQYCKLANQHKVGFILEAVTWRASMDWASKLNYSKDDLIRILHDSIQMFDYFREQYENQNTKIVFSGCIGPRGDGYVPDEMMSIEEAEEYHSLQIEAFSDTEADMMTALTLNYVDEAIGIARAAKMFNMPVVISFTCETDGNLPTGQSLKDAIEEVEDQTGGSPIYYKINCAHPTHFYEAISKNESWLDKVRSIRANASCLSHAELDEAEELDEGDPVELGLLYKDLMTKLPNLNVLGGCCGTDHKHIEQISKICFK